MKRALTIAVVVSALAAAGCGEDVPVAERVKRECEKMHPYNEYEANNCRIVLMVRYIDDANKSKMDGAYGRVR